MISWPIITFIAVSFAAVVNVADKFIVSKELRDPILCAVMMGFSYILIGAVALIFGSIDYSLKAAIPPLIAGMILGFSSLIYYYTLEHNEVSRFIPLKELGPLVALILATIFLNEVFTLTRYLGFALLVSGSIIISLKKDKNHKFGLRKVFGLAIFFALLSGTRGVLYKVSSLQDTFLTTIFWVAIGGLIIATSLFIYHHPRILSNKKWDGIHQLFIVAILFAACIFLFVYAVSLGPVSLVYGFSSMQSMLVFLLVLGLNKFKPGLLKERLTKKVLTKKIIAILLIIIGAILIV